VSIEVVAQAVAQASALYLVGWLLGNRLLRFASRAGWSPDVIGLPERALAGVVGAVAFCSVLMVAHIVTGGSVFGNAWVVPIASLVVVAGGLRNPARPRRVSWVPVAGAAVVLALLYLTPVVIAGSGVRTGDSPWHLGWSQQLLSGDPLPTGPAPEFGRNAYPWGLHAVIATFVRLVPGSDALVAHEALHLFILGAIPLAAACLARLIDRRAGWPAAGAASLIGGWGWISAGAPAFALSPSLAHNGADLVVASPNSVYELFPPALPRELGLVLLAAGGVLIARAVSSTDRRPAIAAGIVVGLAGLVSVPMLLVALVWLCCGLPALGPRPARRRAARAGLAALVAFATVAVWLAPVVVLYIDFGGFVDITPELGVEWPLPSALWSWGLLLPLAALGLGLTVRRASGPGPKAVVVFAAATALLLALAIARGRLGWNLGGNATLLHQGRMWPAAHLLGAAFGGVALLAILDRAARRSDRLAGVALAAVLAAGVISPVFASTRLSDVMKDNHKGFLYNHANFEDGSFVRRAARELDAGDIVRVDGSDGLGFALFQFAGVKLASFDDDRLTGNDLRIRYAELAKMWDERVRDGGFEADFTVVAASEAASGVPVLARGSWQGDEWVLLTGDLNRT
jgi:hypothetical protein